MENWLLIQLTGLGDLLKGLFVYIFPEYPNAGVFAAIISFLLCGFYILKAGFFEGLKIGAAIMLILIMVLFSIHHIAMIFSSHP